MPKITEKPEAPKKVAPKPGKPRRAKVPSEERTVKYPALKAIEAFGDDAVTVEQAKEYLGWTEVEGDVYHLTDHHGKKILLKNSTRNRPFYKSLGEQYAHEVLNLRWRLNGEPRIIGKYGEVISGQHSLSGLVLADQIRQANPHWEGNWPGPCTMSTFLVVGIEETDDVVNTCDTGKPRSIGDTIYRSEHFADLPPKERKTASRAAGYALKMIWMRTGADSDAFNPSRSHGAMLEFLGNHKTLVRCVRHVITEDKGGKVSDLLPVGYASAMMYLMAQSKTDPAQYVVKSKEALRSEKYLDLSMLDKAEEFWTLVGDSEELKAVRQRIKLYAARKDEAGEPIPVTLGEKLAIVTLAWLRFAEGEEVKVSDCTPKYHPAKDDGDQPLMKNAPTLGGIDRGEDSDPPETEEDEDDDQGSEVEAVEERKAQVDEERANGQPTTKAKSMADEIREQYTAVAKDHDGKMIFFKSRTSGGLTTIDADAAKAAKILKSAATKDPGGFVRFTLSKAESQKKLHDLLEAGLKVVIAEEVPTGKLREKTTKVTEFTGGE